MIDLASLNEKQLQRFALAESMGHRAEVGPVQYSYQRVVLGGDLYPQNLVALVISAKVAGKKFNAALAVRDDLMRDKFFRDTAEQMLQADVKLKLVESLFENPNIIGPKGKLP